MTRILALALALFLAVPAAAQVGKSLGVVDANTIAEADLAKLPGMTPAIAKAVVAARPFDSIVDLNKFLLAQKLTQEQANEIYKHAFPPPAHGGDAQRSRGFHAPAAAG